MHVMKDKCKEQGYKAQQLDVADKRINNISVDYFKGVHNSRKEVYLYITKYSRCA